MQWIESILSEDPASETPGLGGSQHVRPPSVSGREEALEAYNVALAAAPENFALHKKYGQLLLKEGKTADALEELQKAAKLAPPQQAAELYSLLGELHQGMGNAREAAKAFEVAAALGGASVVTGRASTSKALGFFEQAAQSNPTSLEALECAGGARWSHGDTREAVSWYKKILALQPNHTVALCRLATAALQEHNACEAHTFLQRAVQGDQPPQEAMALLGYTQLVLGQADKAVESLQAAMRHAAIFPATRLYWALSLMDCGDELAAREEFGVAASKHNVLQRVKEDHALQEAVSQWQLERAGLAGDLPGASPRICQHLAALLSVGATPLGRRRSNASSDGTGEKSRHARHGIGIGASVAVTPGSASPSPLPSASGQGGALHGGLVVPAEATKDKVIVDDWRGALREGQAMEVYSKSATKWLPGTVTQVLAETVKVTYVIDGQWCEKMLLKSSDSLRIRPSPKPEPESSQDSKSSGNLLRPPGQQPGAGTKVPSAEFRSNLAKVLQGRATTPQGRSDGKHGHSGSTQGLGPGSSQPSRSTTPSRPADAAGQPAAASGSSAGYPSRSATPGRAADQGYSSSSSSHPAARSTTPQRTGGGGGGGGGAADQGQRSQQQQARREAHGGSRHWSASGGDPPPSRSEDAPEQRKWTTPPPSAPEKAAVVVSSQTPQSKLLAVANDVPDAASQLELLNTSELTLGKKLGSGGFGAVYHGRYQGMEVAVKKLHINDGQVSATQVQEFQKEVACLQALRHPRLVCFIGAAWQTPSLCIVTEFMPNGSLYALLHQRKTQLEFIKRLSMAIQITEGVEFLHGRAPPFVHRDLKSLNVVLDFALGAKLCDFGLTQSMEKTHISRRDNEGGSPRYMAPELFDCKGKITEKVDMWALGCLALEVFTGRLPHEECNALQQVMTKTLIQRQLPYLDTSGLKEQLQTLAKGCFEFQPQKRLDATSFLEGLRALQ